MSSRFALLYCYTFPIFKYKFLFTYTSFPPFLKIILFSYIYNLTYSPFHFSKSAHPNLRMEQSLNPRMKKVSLSEKIL